MKISRSFLAAIIIELTNSSLPPKEPSNGQRGDDDPSVNLLLAKINTSPWGTNSKGTMESSEQATEQNAMSILDGSTVETFQTGSTPDPEEDVIDLKGWGQMVPDFNNLGSAEKILSKVQSASMKQKTSLMMALGFYFPEGHQIIEAIEKDYYECLKYWIMAEYDDVNEAGEKELRSAALKKELAGEIIPILLEYAKGKSWCPLEHWQRRVNEFKIDPLMMSDMVPVWDIFQEGRSSPKKIKEAPKEQLTDRQLLDKLAKHDAVEIFKAFYEQGKLTGSKKLKLGPILKHKSMEILKFLSSKDVPFTVDSFDREHYKPTLNKTIETGELEVFRYLFKYSGEKGVHGCIEQYVSLDTLKLLYAEENKQFFTPTTFKNLNVEGIMFLVDLGIPTSFRNLLNGIVTHGYPELKEWALKKENWDRFQDWEKLPEWDSLIMKEFDFVKKLHEHHGFIPPIHAALGVVYEDGRLDIVKWYHEVKPQDIINSFEWGIMHATRPILDWISESYSQDQFKVTTNLLNLAVSFGGYEFIEWAEENGFGLPDSEFVERLFAENVSGLADNTKMLNWLKGRGVIRT